MTSRHGDALEVTIAGWAKRCTDQAGLVVLPHVQYRSVEHAADRRPWAHKRDHVPVVGGAGATIGGWRIWCAIVQR
jgi:hypothetical protein